MRLIDADALKKELQAWAVNLNNPKTLVKADAEYIIDSAPTIDAVSVVRCEDCRKSHIDGKTTHYLWCSEWGRSTDTFGYCERGEREGE